MNPGRSAGGQRRQFGSSDAEKTESPCVDFYKLLVGTLMLWVAGGFTLASPLLLNTNLPPYGSSQVLAGAVTGVDPAAFAVAVYIYVPGYGWVSKPSCAKLLTPIAADGSWTADVATGGSDTLATRIAAFLVRSNASLACVQGQPFLTNAYALAVAGTVITRPYPGPRWLRFSGYDWSVKVSSDKVGPGPNYFSDSTNNVWLDRSGNLHLKITNRSNEWQCAEIVSARSFGFGSYRFEVLSDVNALDANVVLGLFTWSDDPAYAHREIDIECSRWSNPSDPSNAQFAVQPYYLPAHLVRYTALALLTNATHCFTWESNRIVFQSQRGVFSPNPAASNVISRWTYTQAPPLPGDENVRFNLWLNGGNAPTNGREVEVIIKLFEFVPLGQGSPATLLHPHQTTQGAAFHLLTEPDRRYTVQRSADLTHWEDDLLLLATNLSSPVVLPDPTPGPTFFRAVTLP